MASSDLEDLALHINTKISDVKRTLQLRNAGEEPSFKSMLGEIKHEILLVKDLLNKMEMEVKDHKELNDLLKELQKSAESQAMEARHLIENIPRCLLKPTQSWYVVHGHRDTSLLPAASSCSPAQLHSFILYINNFVTCWLLIFIFICRYMKGRLTCDQVNAVVKGINKAVADKYKILHQPLRSLKAAARKLYNRFLEDETAESKGIFNFFFPLKPAIACSQTERRGREKKK
uniref:SKA complex subunit 1 n=1 Tax=Athene cunicularia TaxID=194338 RepID=A0A663N0B5_ATHCN